jgi:pimeloyl-ACP methyl ester carboxylesterase
VVAHSEDFIQVGPAKVELLKGGSGDPLVVFHQDIGNPGWMPFHDELAKRFTVYAPSHPGFGKSDRPDWARNARDMAGLHQWLIKELGLVRPAVIGLGFGGWIAAEIAALAPRQFSGMVLVGAVGVQPREGEIMDQFLVSTIDYVRAGFADQSNFDKIYGVDPDVDQLEVWEINREMTTRVAWKPYLFDQALPHLLPSVDIPTLAVWGSEDRQVPIDCAKRYAEAIPNAKLEILQGAGHYAELEKPEELAKLASDFLGTA